MSQQLRRIEALPCKSLPMSSCHASNIFVSTGCEYVLAHVWTLLMDITYGHYYLPLGPHPCLSISFFLTSFKSFKSFIPPHEIRISVYHEREALPAR